MSKYRRTGLRSSFFVRSPREKCPVADSLEWLRPIRFALEATPPQWEVIAGLLLGGENAAADIAASRRQLQRRFPAL